MHTLMVIGGGLLLLALMLGVSANRPGAARTFLPIWAVAALLNMAVGVLSAGYSVADEAPVLLAVFGVPAAMAVATLWWFGKEA